MSELSEITKSVMRQDMVKAILEAKAQGKRSSEKADESVEPIAADNEYDFALLQLKRDNPEIFKKIMRLD